MTSPLISVVFATSISCHIFSPSAAHRFTYRARRTGGGGTSGIAATVSRGAVSRGAESARAAVDGAEPPAAGWPGTVCWLVSAPHAASAVSSASWGILVRRVIPES
jgi:hypothetical protein